MSDTLVRIWDSDMKLVRELVDVVQVTKTPTGRAFDLDYGSEVATWLLDQDVPRIHVTIDAQGDRWYGSLMEWEIKRVGAGAHCDHCQRKLVATRWG